MPAGKPVTEPATPQKDGYIFGGWYTAEGVPWDFSHDLMPRQDLTLYARWLSVTIPRTGDDDRTALWWALLLGSGLGLAVLWRMRRRTN